MRNEYPLQWRLGWWWRDVRFSVLLDDGIPF